MVYVVERYLPGLSRANLLPRLSRLEPVIEQLRGEGSVVRYLGSTIVLEDEACFCQFEGPSVAAVAEANHRAEVPFDRIVPAVLVQPTHRSSEMSVSTFIPKTAKRQPRHAAAAVVAIAAVVVLASWAIAIRAVHADTRSVRSGAPTQASVLRSLTPAGREYVLAISSTPPAELAAAFNTSQPSASGRNSGVSPHATRSGAPSLASVLRSLTPRERRYVLGIASLTPLQLWAAFGTSPTPPVSGRR
ncbi:MAG TPA: nickel-binding protein [Solirubrobacteraceae bacterium]|nr:nickel-binding protein [Solirubrobacteraceae bacterium]